MLTRARPLLGVALLVALLATATAQDKPPPKETPKEDYREFFKPPESVADFWTALQFEMELGRYELAAKLLHGLLERKPTDEELLRLEEKEGGLAPFLRLRTVPQWSDNKATHDQAVKDADELAQRIGNAIQKVLGDRKRINRLIKNLSGDAEERAYGAKELYRVKALAIPPMIDTLREATGEEREAILTLLPRLSQDTVAPLAAALDIPDDNLRVDIINVFLKRAEPENARYLWYLAGAPKTNPAVKSRAQRAIAALTERPVESLVPAPLALTREAERYYRHQVTFPNLEKVVVWRWDGKELVQGWPGSPTVNASRAEEYYGLRFARQALDIDPTYAPAQEVFLSLALEKAVERAGIDKPLVQASPEVAELLATVSPSLLVRVLDRAIGERRSAVVVGAVRALGDLRDPIALRPGPSGEPPLVRALNYPDRRAQMAAAEAILRMPGETSVSTAGRVVEVCRRAIATEPGTTGKPKVLVAFSSEAMNDRVARALADAGFDSVRVQTGREALRRLESAADIDALLVDTQLPDPGLAPLLAQLRASVSYGRLPLYLFLPGETQESLRRQVQEVDQGLAEFRTGRDRLVQEKSRAEQALLRTTDPSQAEGIKQQIEQIDKRIAAYTLEKENGLLALRKALQQDLLSAPRDRELSLTRLVGRYPNVWLLPQSAALSAKALKETLGAQLSDASVKPLSAAEKKEFAERCIIWLARAARGELPGYDIAPAADALYAALRRPGLSEEAQKAAIEAVSRLPAARAQTELAGVVQDAKRPLAVRIAATAALQRHIQEHTSALGRSQVAALADMAAAPGTDPALRAQVALVIGSTHPDARLTGERLKLFDPTPRAPAPAPTPKEKAADPEADKK